MKTLLLTLCLSLASLAAPRAETLHFVTEEYPPFNYLKDGRITGVGVEQAEAIARAAGIDYTLEIMPWARAFALAEHQPMHCVFTTGYNRERADRFVWIGPLLKDQIILLKRKGDGHGGLTLAEALKLKVGSQRGDFAVEALATMGFKNVDLAADIDVTVGKLLSGRIDLLPAPANAYRRMIAEGLPVEKAMTMAGQVYGIACQKDMPRTIVERLQAELDKLIFNGSQDRIFKAYGLPPNTHGAENDAMK